MARKYMDQVIGLGSSVVIARLLTPHQIGVFSVGIAVVGLAQVIRDLGIGRYIIQEKDLTHDRLRTAFGIMLTMSWSIGLLIFALRHIIADFYQEPGLVTVLSILSINFLILPFGAPINSLLNREMRFGTLFWVSTPAVIAQAGVSIGMAAFGFGYISLAWGAVANVAVTALMVMAQRPDLIGLKPSFKEWRRVVGFSSYATGASIMNQVSRQAPDLILGRFLGFAPVGLYSRAEGLIRLFQENIIGPLWQVSLPSFGKAHREGREFRPQYYRLISCVTGLALPFFCVAAILAWPIIRILFGDQWDGAVPIARYLCVAQAILALTPITNSLLTGTGHIKSVFRLSTVTQTLTIAGIAIGSQISLEAVAISLIPVNIVKMIVHSYYLRNKLDIHFSKALRSSVTSLGIVGASVLVPLWAALFVGFAESNLFILFPPVVLGAAGCWLAAVFLFKHPLREEVSMTLRQVARFNL